MSPSGSSFMSPSGPSFMSPSGPSFMSPSGLTRGSSPSLSSRPQHPSVSSSRLKAAGLSPSLRHPRILSFLSPSGLTRGSSPPCHSGRKAPLCHAPLLCHPRALPFFFRSSSCPLSFCHPRARAKRGIDTRIQEIIWLYYHLDSRIRDCVPSENDTLFFRHPRAA